MVPTELATNTKLCVDMFHVFSMLLQFSMSNQQPTHLFQIVRSKTIAGEGFSECDNTKREDIDTGIIIRLEAAAGVHVDGGPRYLVMVAAALIRGTIRVTPKSAVLATSSEVKSTFMADKSRWMMGGELSPGRLPRCAVECTLGLL